MIEKGILSIPAQHAVAKPVQGVPQHLCEKWKPEFVGYMCDLLNVGHLKLLLDAETVKEVPTKYDGVLNRTRLWSLMQFLFECLYHHQLSIMSQ